MSATTRRTVQAVKSHYPEFFLLWWLLLPNFANWHGKESNPLHWVGSILVSLCVFSLPAVFVPTRRALFLANAPWALFSGVLAAFIVRYDAPITSGMMQSLLQTNWREASEQLNRYLLPALFSAVSFVGYIVVAWRLPNEPMKHRRILIACGLWSLLGLIYLPYAGFEAHERFSITLDTHFYKQAYPINLIDSTSAALREHRQRGNRLVQLPFTPPLLSGERKIVVLIIGESTRAQSFTQIGEVRSFFRNYPSLVYFSDALAQSNFTDASVPMLLTGARTLEDVSRLPFLTEWQNAAGCVTAVISNNTSYAFSGASMIRDVVGDSGIAHHSRYDHDMLGTLDGLIATTSPRHLCVILHMAGSHFDYSARYRKQFERYPVVGTEQERLRAAYRNSVVMVQDFIARVIDRLSRAEGHTFLVYTSDHGENLMEIDGLREHVTSRPTEFELRVPLLFWANKNYREHHPQKWQQLINNHRLPVSNREVLPTLLDAMALPPASFSHGESLMRDFVPVERYFIHPDHSLRSEKTLLREP